MDEVLRCNFFFFFFGMTINYFSETSSPQRGPALEEIIIEDDTTDFDEFLKS